MAAASAVGQVPFGQLIPIPAYQQMTALMTPSAGGIFVMHIADIGMMDAVFQGDLPCLSQCRRRGGNRVQHFPIRVEGGEMQRHIRP